jgi:hypothetical protein
MRGVRDTFLHFLADSADLNGVSIHPIRQDPENPNAGLLQANAINVQFLDSNATLLLDTYKVSIDVLNDDENTAVDWVEKVKRLLRYAYMTPLLDYSADPANPVRKGTMLMWSPPRFRPVTSAPYAHFACTLSIQYRFE